MGVRLLHALGRHRRVLTVVDVVSTRVVFTILAGARAAVSIIRALFVVVLQLAHPVVHDVRVSPDLVASRVLAEAVQVRRRKKWDVEIRFVLAGLANTGVLAKVAAVISTRADFGVHTSTCAAVPTVVAPLLDAVPVVAVPVANFRWVATRLVAFRVLAEVRLG